VATKSDLAGWLRKALVECGGRASIVDVCKKVWSDHEEELRTSGDLFFTWQYDIRWTAHRLRKNGVMNSIEASQAGIWELADD
jgi:hypothetical protein